MLVLISLSNVFALMYGLNDREFSPLIQYNNLYANAPNSYGQSIQLIFQPLMVVVSCGKYNYYDAQDGAWIKHHSLNLKKKSFMFPMYHFMVSKIIIIPPDHPITTKADVNRPISLCVNL